MKEQISLTRSILDRAARVQFGGRGDNKAIEIATHATKIVGSTVGRSFGGVAKSLASTVWQHARIRQGGRSHSWPRHGWRIAARDIVKGIWGN